MPGAMPAAAAAASQAQTTLPPRSRSTMARPRDFVGVSTRPEAADEFLVDLSADWFDGFFDGTDAARSLAIEPPNASSMNFGKCSASQSSRAVRDWSGG